MQGLPWSPNSRTWGVALLAAVLVAIAVLASTDATATVKDGFEIDANASSGANFSKAGYYAGIQENSDDWASQAAIPATGGGNNGADDCQTPPASGAQPAFLACNSDRTDVPTCYGSRIVANPSSAGQEVLICDGNSGGASSLQAELDIVSSFSGCSDQKTNDRRWCLKTAGVLNNPSKSDETHGYVLLNRTATCPADAHSGSPHTHNFIIGGYERLSNSGSVFAGFVFAQKAPVTIPSGSNAILSFEDQGDGQGTRRSVGDILVLLNQNGNVIEMSTSVAGADLNGDGVPDFGTPTLVTPGSGICGSFAATNDDGNNRTSTDSILAPPWLGNFCDPTSANPNGGSGLVGVSSNQCRVIGNTPPPCTAIPPCPAGGNLVPPSDFVEFALDLTASGIGTNICDLSNVIMTSRSTNEFSADLKDVATKQFAPLCGAAITITPDNVNEVGESHTFTVTVTQTINGVTTPVAGVVPTISFPGGTPGTVNTTDCDAGTDSNGQCDVVINSAVAGTFTAKATASVNVGGSIKNVSTDPAEGGTGNATKIFVNALIRLTPATDSNEVNGAHDITCEIDINAGSGWTDAPDGTVCDGDIVSGPGTFVSDDDDCTISSGTCILTINSAVAGTTVVSACTEEDQPPPESNAGLVITVTINGTQYSERVSRCTDGQTVETGFANGSNVNKIHVNALIRLSPATDTNEVNGAHDITCEIDINAGAGWTDAPDGTLCDADIVSGPGSFVGDDDDCLIASGTCIVTINSAVAGTTVVSACTEEDQPPPASNAGLTITPTNNVPVTLSRCTDEAEVETGFSNGGTVEKVHVNALISLSPATDSNEVNGSHDITCEIDINDGSGWGDAPDGTVCDADIVSGPGTFVGGVDSCTLTNGTCTISINSAVAGTTVVSACTEEDQPPPATNAGLTITPSNNISVSVSRCTDGQEVETGFSNGSNVNKIHVNAFITITPETDTNPAGTNHVLTCHIEVNLGEGGGFVLAPEGTLCDMDLDASGPGSFVGDVDSCTTVGTTGECTVTITSNVEGTDIITACTEEDQNTPGLTITPSNNVSVTLTRCTDGSEVETGVSNSEPAEKIWVLGSLTWEKRDDLGNLQGGATFEVCRTHGSAGTDIVPDECFTVVDDSAPDTNLTPGQLTVGDLFLGTYKVCETVAPPGFALDDEPCRENIVVDLTTPDVQILDDFVNRLGSISWEKRDDLGNLQGGATFTVDPNPFDCHNGTVGDETAAITVVDNGANDDDDTAGEISIDRVCLGTYTICETVAPAGFAVDDDECRENIVVNADNLNVTVPDDFVNRLGTLEWEKRDESQLVNLEHPLQGGATFKVFGGDPNDAANGDGEGPFACQDTESILGDDEDNPVLVADDVDGTTGAGDIDQDPEPGQFKLVRVCLGTYTVLEFDAPDGYAKDDDDDRVETVSDDNNGLDDDSDGTIDDAEEFNAVIGEQDVDDDSSLVDEFDFHNRRGTLLFEKRSKNRQLGLGQTELVGGASFRITPDPLGGTHSCGAGTLEDPTVPDCLEITDGDSNDSFAATGGRICLDGVALTTTIGYTIQEVASNNPAYAIDDDDVRGPISVTTSTTCADRVNDPADADYFENIPLSEIEIEFRSLAGDGVTQLETPIVCEPVGVDDTDADSDGSDPDHPYDDATLDRNEVFTSLEPGLYTCYIDIDP